MLNVLNVLCNTVASFPVSPSSYSSLSLAVQKKRTFHLQCGIVLFCAASNEQLEGETGNEANILSLLLLFCLCKQVLGKGSIISKCCVLCHSHSCKFINTGIIYFNWCFATGYQSATFAYLL